MFSSRLPADTTVNAISRRLDPAAQEQITVAANILNIWEKAVFIAERVIATIVFIAVIAFTVLSFPTLANMDWSNIETFYALIYRVLLIVIGMELVRMLVTHSIAAVLELLAFVIARKMLHPDLTSVDIMLGVVAFVALMGSRHYFTEGSFEQKKS